MWIASDKKIKLTEIAARLGVSDVQIRRWKSQDKWDGNDNERKVTGSVKGAPYGNKNAVGNSGGAPKGNTNSKTHGGYSRISVDFLTEDELTMYSETPDEARDLLIHELALQKIRERRVFNYINEIRNNSKNEMTLERVVNRTIKAHGVQERREQSTEAQAVFDAILKAEEALSRIQGNISNSIRLLHQMGVDDATIELKRKAFDAKYNSDGSADTEEPDPLSASLESLAEELNQ